MINIPSLHKISNLTCGQCGKTYDDHSKKWLVRCLYLSNVTIYEMLLSQSESSGVKDEK